MLTALLISMPALSGNISVLNSAGTTTEEPAADQSTTPPNANLANDNTSGALIETPATNSFAADANAASEAASNAAPAANTNAPAANAKAPAANTKAPVANTKAPGKK